MPVSLHRGRLMGNFTDKLDTEKLEENAVDNRYYNRNEITFLINTPTPLNPSAEPPYLTLTEKEVLPPPTSSVQTADISPTPSSQTSPSRPSAKTALEARAATLIVALALQLLAIRAFLREGPDDLFAVRARAPVPVRDGAFLDTYGGVAAAAAPPRQGFVLAHGGG
ncbi:hypothetical protein MMC34_003410 [Xylographa carneopallida]|nr:hypothetical protein [Xylographa carneopallida]